MDKLQIQMAAKLFMSQLGQRVTDDEIRAFLDALGPVLKERIRLVLITIDIKPKK